MLGRIRRLPSPALVIAAIALVLAVGGGSFALATSDNKQDKKIANKQINRRFAFAQVSATGHVKAAHSRGVAQANVRHPDTGVYCFKNLGFAPKGLQVTIDAKDSSLQYAQDGLGGGSPCPAHTQAFVNPETTGNAGFFVLLYH